MDMDNQKLIDMLPPETNANRGFWEGTLVGELRLQYGDSGVAQFPEYPVDRVSLGDKLEWRAASGRATLWSWVVMHQRYFPAFADEVPYLVAFVQLEEGPFMMATLVDPPADLQCGAALEVVFERLSDDRAIPKFKVVNA
ncbi:OB-fold domain-containing protein [Variovorax sp. J31P207]|uniref:Zn-ribbon domain-containing OB-fold protein n=1 Tax=Variovorax sp. J31P207 TaxID=3053510 RepID=UPI0025773D85|nr:OB-fold domain-containing protein [Variovorax sp. J31P207]MDM0072690.1 OB-fold domain-containing protein [Variovorax sp. J31P207]